MKDTLHLLAFRGSRIDKLAATSVWILWITAIAHAVNGVYLWIQL